MQWIMPTGCSADGRCCGRCAARWLSGLIRCPGASSVITAKRAEVLASKRWTPCRRERARGTGNERLAEGGWTRGSTEGWWGTTEGWGGVTTARAVSANVSRQPVLAPERSTADTPRRATERFPPARARPRGTVPSSRLLEGTDRPALCLE